MKHIYSAVRRPALLLTMIVALMGVMTSCSSDDDYFYPSTDPSLYGYWELAYANGMPVTGFQQNFFEFDSDGYGDYLYYVQGRLYESEFNYWCSSYNYSYNTLNISYDDGRNSTMQYYFDRMGNLVMTWNSPQGRMVYIYTRTAPF